MLDVTFAALADPTRREIVTLLAESDRSVGELVEQFSISQSAVSRHLSVLENAKLVARRRDGQRRICSLQPEPLAEIHAWVEHYQRYWSQSLARLDKAVTGQKRE